jgi:hypothetical protein
MEPIRTYPMRGNSLILIFALCLKDFGERPFVKAGKSLKFKSLMRPLLLK